MFKYKQLIADLLPSFDSPSCNFFEIVIRVSCKFTFKTMCVNVRLLYNVNLIPVSSFLVPVSPVGKDVTCV